MIDLGENYVKQTYRNRCDIMTANGPSSLTVQVVKGGSKDKRPVRDMRIDYSKRWQHQHREALVSAYRNAPYFEHYRDYFVPFFERRFEFLADLDLQLMELLLKLTKAGPMPELSERYIVVGEADVDLRGDFPRKGGAAIEAATGGADRKSITAVTETDGHDRTGAGIAGMAARTSDTHTAGIAGRTEPGEHGQAGAQNPGHAGAKNPADISPAGLYISGTPAFAPYWQVFSDRFPFAPNLSVIDLLFCEGPEAKNILLSR